MSEKALATYTADVSGPFAKPFPGTNVPERNRLDRFSHQGFKTAFTGPALAPTAERYRKNLVAKCEELDVGAEWVEYADFNKFFQNVHGAALLQAVMGPSLLKINPNFMEDVWIFDECVPWLARMTPAFIKAEPHAVRIRVREQLKKWYAYARANFHEGCIDADGDGDPYWGSGLIRYQQKGYLEADGFDDDALACADLSFLWG